MHFILSFANQIFVEIIIMLLLHQKRVFARADCTSWWNPKVFLNVFLHWILVCRHLWEAADAEALRGRHVRAQGGRDQRHHRHRERGPHHPADRLRSTSSFWQPETNLNEEEHVVFSRTFAIAIWWDCSLWPFDCQSFGINKCYVCLPFPVLRISFHLKQMK